MSTLDIAVFVFLFDIVGAPFIMLSVMMKLPPRKVWASCFVATMFVGWAISLMWALDQSPLFHYSA
jgi:hypothetical protein